MSQTERILYIDRKMRTVGKVTVNECAKHFEISTRQIKRDIEYLRDRFNAPIVYDRTIKGYIYNSNFKTLEFADQKLIMFYVAIKSLTESEHYIPIYTDDVIKNLENDVPKDYRDVCKKISYQIPKFDAINPDFFVYICEALRDKKCLCLEYINLKGLSSERIVEPEHLINYDGSWYMICFDQKNQDIRTFNMSRIKEISLSKKSYSKHDSGYVQELKQYLSESFGIFKGKKKFNVTINFYDTAKEIIKTQIWHPNQILKNYDDYTQLTLPIADFTEVLSRIMAFGAKAKPIEPNELVNLWKDEIKKMNKLL